MREAVDGGRNVLGNKHFSTLDFAENLGDLYHREGRYENAQLVLDEVFDARVRAMGEHHSFVGRAHYALGCLAAARGQRDMALAHLGKALERG